MLLDAGADINQMTHPADALLHRISKYAGKFLGRQTALRDSPRQTPEEVASARGHVQVAALIRAEATRRAQCEAFAMGLRERLGAGSLVLLLDAEVVRMILVQMRV